MSDLSDNYVCEHCGGTFTKGVPDEEAMAESLAMFGAMPAEDLAIVCDDCWNAMGFGEAQPSPPQTEPLDRRILFIVAASPEIYQFSMLPDATDWAPPPPPPKPSYKLTPLERAQQGPNASKRRSPR